MGQEVGVAVAEPDVGVWIGVLVGRWVAVETGVFAGAKVAVEVWQPGTWACTCTSSTHQPEEPAELSVPSRKRKRRFCPLTPRRSTATKSKLLPPGLVCPQALLPASGLPKPVAIMPLYGPVVKYWPASSQFAPPSVDNSSTPPS